MTTKKKTDEPLETNALDSSGAAEAEPEAPATSPVRESPAEPELSPGEFILNGIKYRSRHEKVGNSWKDWIERAG